MGIADIIVTKPGGASIAELLALEVCPIFIAPIPGQETENVRALESYGIGITAHHPIEIRDTIVYLKDTRDCLLKMQENIRKLKRTSSIEVIYDVIRTGGIRITR